MEIIITDNTIYLPENSGIVFYLENVDNNFIHIGFGDGMIVGLQVIENTWNNLSFSNSDDLMVYLNSIITLPIIENPNE
jgi:hypothetical protein